MSYLIETTIRLSVVLLTALAAVPLLNSRSAAFRHWVLAAAVACAWATPLLSRIVPIWLPSPSVWETNAPREDRQARDRTAADIVSPQDTAVSSEVASSVDPPARSSRPRIGGVAWGLWLAGALLCSFILLVGLARLRWLASQARVLSSGPWWHLADALRRSYGLRSPVRLLQSTHSSLLVTWGWRRPTILLPAAAESWSDERMRIVLAHELAHTARGDWIVQLAAETLRSLLWFNPLLWTTCRRLRIESECACDDEVLARGVRGPEYASHLLALARSLHPGRQRWLPAPAMARPSSLEGRVHAMLNTRSNRRPPSLQARAVILAAMAALTVPAAGLWAQARFYSFTGIVFDPTNRALPGATMVLVNATSNAKYEVQSDGTGRFEFVGLPPAPYKLEASRPGFALLREEIQITGSVNRDLRLKVGSLQETVTVPGGNGPPRPQDPETARRRLEAQRKFLEFAEQTKAQCAAGAPSPLGGNILPPAKLLDVKPIYPEHLRLAKVGGVVTLDALIGTDGTVQDVPAVKGPDPDLERAAVEAVRQWRFSPTLLNCVPIDVNMKVTVSFAPQQ